MSKNSPEFEYSVFIEQNHPATDGHFIGNPILPGVVILEHVRVAFLQFREGMRLVRLNKVKNVGPLKPGKMLIVKLQQKKPDTYGFVCLDSDGNSIANGDFYAEAIASASPSRAVEAATVE